MKYKALFLDIDDTLICKTTTISKGNLDAIRRAQEAGIFVTIATGRGYMGASVIWKQLNLQGPVIVFGGACIMDTRTDSPIFLAGVDTALIREAFAYAKEWGLTAQLYQGDAVICEAENEFTRGYTANQKLPCVIDPKLTEKDWFDVPKVLVYTEPGDTETEMIQRFAERFSDRLEVATSRPGYIELNKLGSNKGTAILKAAELLGIRPEETVAVGDNTLDLQMIQMAGLGVCVENGQQVVKDVADIIAPACNKDGVAWVIDHIMLAN